MLQLFRQNKDRKSLKDAIERLSQTESGIWQLTQNPILREGIPAILRSMNLLVVNLSNELAEIHTGRTSEFHVNIQAPTPLAKEIYVQLLELEELLSNQIKLLQNITNLSQGEVENILNHNKTSDVSRTSQIIQELIKKLEGGIAEINEIPKYELVKGNTYAKALAELRRRGHEPLTMEENFQLRVDLAKLGDFNLFNTWLDCCYAILYKGDGIHFKLVMEFNDNALLDSKNFDKMNEVSSLPCTNYDSITGDGVYEFSINETYNKDLSKEEIFVHPFYKALFKGKENLLKEYVEIYFTRFQKSTAMGIYLIEKNKNSEWRSVYVYDDSGYSRLGGYGLSDFACFVLRP